MNIFLYELKAYRKSTIIWTVSLIALVIMFLSMFPGFAKDASGVQKLLQGYPEAVRKALGISVESITSFLGYYSFIFVYILLCGAIQAMNLGTSVISKEMREKTADFLLTKPVNRKKIMTSKLLAVLISVLISDTAYLIFAVIMAQIVKREAFSMKIFLMISITLLFTQLIFIAIGVIVSVVVPRIKSVISVSLGTVFGFFIISMFSSAIGDDALRYITPFKYFDTAYIIKNGSYETSFAVIEMIFIVLALAASYFIYSKKDIHTV